MFEGLPVRHWDRTTFTSGVAPKDDLANNGAAYPELPMPKESHLLSEMSRALLQAARAGTVNRPAPPPAEEDALNPEEEEKPVEADSRFVTKKWTIIPRAQEKEPEYLARKREGLPPAFSGAGVGAVVMKKTKVKKIDAEGNSHVYEVMVPEGQTVEGEIAEAAEAPAVPEAPAPGTVVDGVGVVNSEGVVVADVAVQPTPPRRKPPPPKRKAKGPGRGRKKKVAFTDGQPAVGAIGGDQPTATQPSNGSEVANGDQPRIEAATPGGTENADDSLLQEGDDDEDDHDEDEGSEEGEIDEGRESGRDTSAEKTPAAPPETETATETATVTETATETATAAAPIQKSTPSPPPRDPSSSPDLPLATNQARQPSQPDISDVQDVEMKGAPVDETQGEPIDEVKNEQVAEKYDQPPPEQALDQEPTTQEAEDENKMEVDDISKPLEIDTIAIVSENQDQNPIEAPADAMEEQKPIEASPIPPPQANVEENSEDVHFEDGEIDLLGSLERHLAGQGGGN